MTFEIQKLNKSGEWVKIHGLNKKSWIYNSNILDAEKEFYNRVARMRSNCRLITWDDFARIGFATKTHVLAEFNPKMS